METCKKVFFLTSFFFLRGFAEGQDMVWKSAFSLEGQQEMAKNNLLTTLPKMTKEWKVSLEVNPTDYSFSSYANVLHLTIGGKGLGSSANVGDRIPAIWIHKTRGVMISSALNGKAAYTKTYKMIPPVREWTKIEVSQTLIESKYIYSISIGKKNVLKVENKKPVELSDVKVFAGSPWYTARKGFLRNLDVQIKVPNCVVAGEFYQCVVLPMKFEFSVQSSFLYDVAKVDDSKVL